MSGQSVGKNPCDIVCILFLMRGIHTKIRVLKHMLSQSALIIHDYDLYQMFKEMR